MHDPAEDLTLSPESLVSTDRLDVYCSCGPTTATQSSVPSGIQNVAVAEGVLVRVTWGDIETSPGQYNWGLIDRQLQLAQQNGDKITLGIINGAGAPDWLKSQAQTFSFTSIRGDQVTLPLPWDTVFLTRYAAFIQALGDRYNGNAALNLVHMTNSTTNGLEMQYALSAADEARFITAGYTQDRLIASWKTIIDAYARAFSVTPLDVEVHPVFRSDTVANTVVDYGYDSLGARFGVFAAWWSEHNATNVYPGMYTLIAEAALRSFATVQMVGATSSSISNVPGRVFGEAELLKAVELAAKTGVKYMEIWNADLFNGALMSTVVSTVQNTPQTNIGVGTGTSGADTLRGDSGANNLQGFGGNDTIDGGAGLDACIYQGARSAYAITGSSASRTISDSTSGRDGVDMLSGIERLQFSDGVLAFDNLPADHAGGGFLLYRAAFDRMPDAAGLGYWIRRLDAGANYTTEMAASFIASPEFIAKYGTGTSNEAFLNLIYQNVLDRAPDAVGLTYWLTQAGGTGLNGGFSRAELLVSFAISTENYGIVSPQITDGIWFV